MIVNKNIIVLMVELLIYLAIIIDIITIMQSMDGLFAVDINLNISL
jgi:hypothetical protein